MHAIFCRSPTVDLDKARRFPHWPAEPGEALVRGAHFSLFICAPRLASAGKSAAF
jgi:hypothetical protein